MEHAVPDIDPLTRGLKVPTGETDLVLKLKVPDIDPLTRGLKDYINGGSKADVTAFQTLTRLQGD